jgi:hypothetical protein
MLANCLPVGDWKWLHFWYLVTLDPDFKVMWWFLIAKLLLPS